MITLPKLINTLLVRDLPGYTISDELDTDTIDELPAIIFNASGAGQTGNGDGLWFVNLDLTVLYKRGQTNPAGAVYDAVHAWPTGAITAFGWVAEVADISLFSPPSTPDVRGRQVRQNAGSFALSLRK